MTGIICMVTAAGGSLPVLDTQTITAGSSSSGSNPIQTWSGYKSASPAIGSIVDGTSNIYGGAAITGLYFTQEGYVSPPVGFVTRGLVLTITGATNSGWTRMLVGSTSFLRADASFSSGTWTWSLPIPDPYITEYDPFTPTTVVQWT